MSVAEMTMPLSVLPVCSLLCCEIKLFLVLGLFLEFDVQLAWAAQEGPCGKLVLLEKGGCENWCPGTCRPWGKALDVPIVELEVAGWKEVGQPILLGTWGDRKAPIDIW